MNFSKLISNSNINSNVYCAWNSVKTIVKKLLGLALHSAFKVTDTITIVSNILKC